MSATEYHVVIACPPYWSETTAATLRTQEDAEGYRV